ncbi:MAG: SprT family zinc-dependent metalloprotease [Pseudomonadota bacterium]
MTRQHRSSHSGPEQLSLFEGSTDAATSEPVPAPPAFSEPAVRISRRARRLALHVGYDGSAELVVPQGTPERDVRQFLDSHRDWLVQARDAQLERYGAFDRSRPEALALSAVGEQWRLERRELPGRRLAARLRPGTAPTEFVLRLDGDQGVAESQEREAVKRQLRRRALDYFRQALPPIADAMNVSYARVQVRAQRSCWGSYSSTGTISMNYAALFLPPELAHYLCVHELAHARHLDHSPAFWKLVERHVPGARELDRRLASRHDVLPGWLL